MIGSSKINEQTGDLERLRELFDQGLNNSQISRVYRTSSGESISRTHVSQIRRGIKWNPVNRSFLMKYELNNPDVVETSIGPLVYKTCISPVITDTLIYYVYFTSVNSIPTFDINTCLMKEKPTRNDLIKFHNQFVFDEVSL